MKTCPKCTTTYENSVGFCPKDGEVLEESSKNIVGQTLDNQYEIEAFIAQGGMGSVYRARHILLGDRVVIKTLRDEVKNNAEFLRRFQREGRAARAFRHPNSVTVYDLRTASDGMIYMVMEYVEGHTLDKELKERGRFTPKEALDVLEPVASVLDAAHARGVVHRDLKPENVMIGRTPDGQKLVKVLDLGIAKITGMGDTAAPEGTSLTIAGQILGTPYYMSPEQWGEIPRDGKPEIDGRADIYSLGVMYYELVAGRKPLGGRTLSELRNEHVQARIVPLNEVAPDVPPAFAQAVMRAMAKDRNDRYPTAGEFNNDLRVALGMAPICNVSGSFAMDKTEENGAPSDSSAATAHVGRQGAATVVTQSLPTGSPSAGAETVAIQDSAATNAGRAVTPPPAAQPLSTVAMNAGQRSAAATSAVRAPGYDSAVVTTPAKKSSLLPIIGGVVALLIVLGGVGGYLALRSGKSSDTGNATNTTGNNTKGVGTTGAGATQPAASNEALQYWIELYDPKQGGAPIDRKAGASITLYSGDKITFDFKPREHGYFYIVGPGEKNAPTAILTAQLPNGLTNEAAANGLFKFPLGNGALTLDNNAGIETYTVVFSPTPLTKPAFLAGKVFHKLTDAELTEFESFRALNAKSPDIAVKDEGGQPTTLVSLPSATQGQPIIFDIRIDHRAKK